MTQRCLPGSRGLQRATGSCSGVSGRQRPAPPGRGGVLVPRGVRRPQGAGPGRRRRRRAAATPPRPENRFLVAHWGDRDPRCRRRHDRRLGGDEQRLVQFYAVSVFASFLAATAGCARLSLRDGRASAAAVNLLGATLVAAVLALNLTRLDALVALLASARWPSTSIAHGSDGAAPPGGRRRGLSAGATSTASSRSAPCTGTRRPPRRTVAKTPRPLSPARLGSSNPTWQQTTSQRLQRSSQTGGLRVLEVAVRGALDASQRRAGDERRGQGLGPGLRGRARPQPPRGFDRDRLRVGHGRAEPVRDRGDRGPEHSRGHQRRDPDGCGGLLALAPVSGRRWRRARRSRSERLAYLLVEEIEPCCRSRSGSRPARCSRSSSSSCSRMPCVAAFRGGARNAGRRRRDARPQRGAGRLSTSKYLRLRDRPGDQNGGRSGDIASEPRLGSESWPRPDSTHRDPRRRDRRAGGAARSGRSRGRANRAHAGLTGPDFTYKPLTVEEPFTHQPVDSGTSSPSSPSSAVASFAASLTGSRRPDTSRAQGRSDAQLRVPGGVRGHPHNRPLRARRHPPRRR